MSEHDEQKKFFQIVDSCKHLHKGFDNIYSIPNAAKRSYKLASYMKAEGLKKGVFDVAIDWPSGSYGAMRIEFKDGKNKPSPDQLLWLDKYKNANMLAIICYSADEAIDALFKYFNIPTINTYADTRKHDSGLRPKIRRNKRSI